MQKTLFFSKKTKNFKQFSTNKPVQARAKGE